MTQRAGGERREANSRPEADHRRSEVNGQRSTANGPGPGAKGQRPEQAALCHVDEEGEGRTGEEQAAAGAFRGFVPRFAFRVSRSQAGFSLVEMLASLAIFGVFLIVLVGLQREFLRYDGEMRVALFTHPSPLSVLARLRRDVLDSRGYPDSEGKWSQSPSTLLLDGVGDDGRALVVVWDFSEPLIARRIELREGEHISQWEARAVPAYRIDSWKAPDGRTGVVVTARDGGGNVVVDQIVTPRAR